MPPGMKPTRTVRFKGVDYWVYPNGLAIPVIAGAGDYVPTTWVEGSSPGISGAQLNRMEAGIDEAVRILDRDMTDTTFTAQAFHTMYSYSIGADVLGATGGVRLTLGFGLLNNTGSNRSIRVRLRLGASIVTGNTVNIVSGAGGRECELVVTIMNLTTGTQFWTGHVIIGPPVGGSIIISGTGTDPSQFTLGGIHFNSAVDTTAAVTLACEIEMAGGSHANFAIDRKLSILEKIPAT